MLYMASKLPIATIRANFLLYLLGIDIVLLSIFAVLGRLEAAVVMIGVILIPIYILANVVGARLFNPDAERAFRLVAYMVIAASAILGLPVWSG